MERRKTLVGMAIGIGLGLAACGGAPGEANLASTQRADVTASAGPIILTMAPAAPLVQGTTVAYTISVTNAGPDPIAPLNVGANFQGASVNGLPGGCVRLGGGLPQIFCSVASLAPGATASFTAQIRPQDAGTVTFSASAGGNGLLVVSATDVEDVAPAPTDVQVTGFASTGSPPLGSAFSYTFQVKNNGPFATFGGVSFTDALPASLSFVSVTSTAGSCTGGAVISCALGDLAVGAQAIVQIAVIAPASPQAVSNTASISLGAQTDRNPANDAVTVTVTPK